MNNVGKMTNAIIWDIQGHIPKLRCSMDGIEILLASRLYGSLWPKRPKPPSNSPVRKKAATWARSMQIPPKKRGESSKTSMIFHDLPMKNMKKPAIKALVNWTFRQIRLLSPCFLGPCIFGLFAWLGKSLRASKPRCLSRPSHGAAVLGFLSPFPATGGCPGFYGIILEDTKKHHTPT